MDNSNAALQDSIAAPRESGELNMFIELNTASSRQLTPELTVEQFYAVCDQLNFNDKERQNFLKLLGVDASATTLLFQF